MKTFKLILATMLLLVTITVFAQETVGIETAYEDTFLGSILNGMPLVTFMASWALAMIGVVIGLLSDIIRREKASTHSPVQFSFKYWWNDNWRRILMTIMVIPIAIISYKQFSGGEAISTLTAFGLGFGSDHLVEIVKRKGAIKGANSK